MRCRCQHSDRFILAIAVDIFYLYFAKMGFDSEMGLAVDISNMIISTQKDWLKRSWNCGEKKAKENEISRKELIYQQIVYSNLQEFYLKMRY